MAQPAKSRKPSAHNGRNGKLKRLRCRRPFIINRIMPKQINTAITADQLMLDASDGVDYNGNLIDVTDLILVGTGLFDFGTSGETANRVDGLAADIDGALVGGASLKHDEFYAICQAAE